MRKVLISLLVTLLLCSNSVIPLKLLNIVSAQQKSIPSYAKWGVFVTKKTQEKYPNAQIIDYLHIGRISGPQSSIERFKLRLRDNRREFGVFINIEYNNETERVIKISYKETLN
ncbi:DUF3889 domain-containing protein [Peribacillus loiseleuriae]|uniref:DUF3889 domain-containing protein n=1 Tax=Peribacillus loiseleuriae TaxID=1679170 RepID=UPI003D03839C